MADDLRRLTYTTQEVQDILDAVADKYEKPSGGIPSSDLASGVQTSLGKADSAYQKPSGGIPKTDLASGVQTSLGKADTALQSYTETDPVFGASAAAGISSSDIDSWDGKQDEISDLSTIRSGASAGATAYQKPSTGIPKTDLASAVQTSLGKADTALQSYTETDPVFLASDAHGISSSDISGWNGKADDNSVVHLTGEETIAGTKTFTSDVEINDIISTENGNDYPEGFEWIQDYNGASLQDVLDTKSEFSGSYNDLTDKPVLPFGTYIGTGTGWGASPGVCYLRTSYFSGGVVPQKEGDLVYSTSTRNLHRCGTVTWDSGQNCYKTTPTLVCYVSGFDGNYSSLSNKPTTLSGYGITDAKIESGTITLGSNTITPMTSFTETDPTVPSWAKEASKPSYTLDEVSDGSTRKLADYLPLTGGTLSGLLQIRISSNPRIVFGTSGAVFGAIGCTSARALQFYDTSSWRPVYHSGNSNKSDVPWECSTLTTNGDVSVTGNITATGTITPGSDSRIKDNQKEISSECAFLVIENLKPKTWVWNEKSNEKLNGKSAAGLVAQEVKEILPDAVTISESGDIKDFHSLNYNTIQGYEIAAIKGLIEENKALKSEVAELKEKLNTIMEMLK